MPKPIPNPGRIIHIKGSGICDDDCRPAIVSGVEHREKTIFLTVFGKAVAPHESVTSYDSDTWHWPEMRLVANVEDNLT